jgi:hypothetical protein
MVFQWGDFWDLWKAIAIALTGLFGIMGLLTSYKDKETGRITGWGKINLAGILLSATMGVASQLVDAQRKTLSAQQAAIRAEASAAIAQATSERARQAATNTERLIGDLVRISRETRKIAIGTEHSVVNSRAAATAGQQAASRTLGVARGTALAVAASQAGLVRVERLVSPFEAPTLHMWVRKKVRDNHPDCPAATTQTEVRVNIGNPDANDGKFDATYEARGKIVHHPLRSSACYFELIAPLEVQENAGDLTSYLDLAGKTLYFDSFGLKIARDEVEKFIVQTPNGQFVRLPMGEAVQDRGWNPNPAAFGIIGFGLHYRFPAGRDPRPGF